MMEKVTEVSMKKIKPGKKQMRGQKSESASRRNSNAKEHTFQKLDDSIVEVRDEEADDETEDERDTEDADFSPNKAENQQKIMKRKQKEVEKLPAKKMKFTLPLSRTYSVHSVSLDLLAALAAVALLSISGVPEGRGN